MLTTKAPKCPQCKWTLRPKEQNDWKKGEKRKKGYYPDTRDYWTCSKCNTAWMSDKSSN